MHPYVTIGLGFLLGAVCGFLAQKKGKNPYFWFFIGALFGLLGIFSLFFISSRERKQKAEEKISHPAIQPPPPAPHTQRLWYYLDQTHKQFGPVSFSDLEKELSQGKIHSSTYVWNEDLENWKQVKDFAFFS